MEMRTTSSMYKKLSILVVVILLVLFLMKLNITHFFALQVAIILFLAYVLKLRQYPTLIIGLYTFGWSAYVYFAKQYLGSAEGMYRYLFLLALFILADTIISNRTNSLKVLSNRLLFFLFVLYGFGYVFSMVGDGSFEFADYHYGRFLTFTLFPIMMVLLLCKDIKHIQSILKVIALVGLLIAVFSFADSGSLQTHGGGHASLLAFNSSANTIARTMMICSLCAVYFFWRSNKKLVMWFWLGIATITLVVAILAQSKQAILSYTLAFLLFIYIAPKQVKKTSMLLVGITSSALILLINFPEYFTRMFEYIDDPNGEGWLRIYYYNDAWQRFLENPLLGTGVGSTYHPRTGERVFPHNLFLEAASDMGLIGLSVILILLIIITNKIRRILAIKNMNNEHKLLAAALIAIIFFNVLTAQVSGSIAGNGRIWFFSIMLWPLYKSLMKFKVQRQRKFIY